MSWVRKPMSDREQRIWDVVYGTTFAMELERQVADILREPARASTAKRLEWTLNNTSAEVSAGRADLAVQRLREWAESEDPSVGQRISIRPEGFGE